MKNAIVRFAALYVFDVVVLLLIGLLFRTVSVGLSALWASVVLTAAALFVKPALTAAFRRSAARSAAGRGRVGEKILQYALVYAVELVIWVGTVVLSGVTARGFTGFALPPLILLVGWVIYDQVDDRLRAKASDVYDAVQTRLSPRRGAAASDASPRSATSSPAADSAATAEGRRELHDGLTAEQRRMFDELG
ncbi:hypothetical protein [Microbacterium sp. XT11]|uniref:hypothetical protein n=1 Tax=Microbacterium sp. XT11 TaxID=367477 RepID=UPI000831F948|nr:hypothetical protein [Microbacterium sp. XT11]